jgi:phage terminase small subunit
MVANGVSLRAVHLTHHHMEAADPNGRQAAIRAGYSLKNGKVTGGTPVDHVNVRAALEAADNDRRQLTDVTPERVLRDIHTAVSLDIAELFDEHGRLKPIHALPLAVRRAVVSIESCGGT